MPKTILDYVQPSQRPSYNQPLHIKGSFLWLSDFEIPFHDAFFINQCFTVAKLRGVQQCVWGGDAIHWESLSPFPGGDNDTESEITEIDEFLPGFLEPFKSVRWIMGNHDDRAQRALQRKISAQQALRLAIAPETMQLFSKKVELSPYYWMTAAHNWQLEHAKNVSMTPAGVAQKLALKFQANVIHGHTHLRGDTTINGFYAIESGCAVDPFKLRYPNIRHTTRPQMAQGAVLMMEWGDQYIPTPLTPDRMEFEIWDAKRK